MIRNNAHKYSVSAMCTVLAIPKSTYYYQSDIPGKRAKKAEDATLSKEVEHNFKANRNNYGTCKIKKELAKLSEAKHISHRRISRLMNEIGLVSNYTVAQFKPHQSNCNELPVKNELKREFNQDKQLAVVVSDLTYARVGKKWHYVCLFVDLFNREIIGHSGVKTKRQTLCIKR